MRSSEDLRRMVRDEIAAGGDEDAAAEAVEEQAREDEADLLLLRARERRRSLTIEEAERLRALDEKDRARAARLRQDS
jgi:hypothetical protein